MHEGQQTLQRVSMSNSEDEWYKVVKAGYSRGLFASVDDCHRSTDCRRFVNTSRAGVLRKRFAWPLRVCG